MQNEKLTQETLKTVGIGAPEGPRAAKVTLLIVFGVSLKARGSPELGLRACCEDGVPLRAVFSVVFFSPAYLP